MPPTVRRAPFDRLARVAFALALVGNGGCMVLTAGAVGGAAVAGYAYARGRMNRIYPTRVEDAWSAAHAALNDLGLPVVRQELGVEQRALDSRSRAGEPVTIDFTLMPSPSPNEGPQVRVGVRVGNFGDEVLSRQILERIDAHLTPVQPVPPTGAVAAPPAETAAPPLAAPEPVKPARP